MLGDIFFDNHLPIRTPTTLELIRAKELPINTMTTNDGWCKNLDRENKKCLIYETRPHFCRVNEFSTTFKGYLKSGDKFLIDCCKQHISSNYGYKSNVMKNFKKAVSGK